MASSFKYKNCEKESAKILYWSQESNFHFFAAIEYGKHEKGVGGAMLVGKIEKLGSVSWSGQCYCYKGNKT